MAKRITGSGRSGLRRGVYNKISFPKYEPINFLPLLNGILFSLW